MSLLLGPTRGNTGAFSSTESALHPTIVQFIAPDVSLKDEFVHLERRASAPVSTPESTPMEQLEDQQG